MGRAEGTLSYKSWVRGHLLVVFQHLAICATLCYVCVYTYCTGKGLYIYTHILRGISDGREPIFLSRSLDSRDAVSTERFRFVVQLNQTDYVDYVQEIKRSDV